MELTPYVTLSPQKQAMYQKAYMTVFFMYLKFMTGTALMLITIFALEIANIVRNPQIANGMGLTFHLSFVILCPLKHQPIEDTNMDTCAPALETIRSILDLNQRPDDSNSRLEPFYEHLTKQMFRPHLNKSTALPIVGALGHWTDLRTSVQQQLSYAVVSKWQAFDYQPEEIAERDVSENKGDTSDPNGADQNSSRNIDAKPNRPPLPCQPGPLEQFSQRRDWFDTILDFVAILIKPIYAMVK